jgi:hypothetical protein
MGSQKTQPASLTRIRDNQRRSRARRKEYIQELEKRLQRFEHLGVETNVEIQAAARKVAYENTLLRSLLNGHGVTNIDIEEHIHTEGKRVVPTLLPARTSDAPVIPQAEMLRQSVLHNSMDGVDTSTFQSIPKEMLERLEKGRILDDGRLAGLSEPVQTSRTPSTPYQSLKPESCQTANSHLAPIPSEARTSVVSTCRCELPGLSRQPQAVDDVTTCEAAANIIASMRGHGDQEAAREELGCCLDEHCMVENVKIFQLIDREEIGGPWSNVGT